MLKKFLLVTTAVVAVHAAEPHAADPHAHARNALSGYIDSMEQIHRERNSIEAERNAFKDKHAQEEIAHGRTRLERQDSHIRHEKEINGLSEAGREFGEFAEMEQEMFYKATPEEMIKSLGNQLRAAKAELAEANLKIKQAEEASREFGEFAEMEQEMFYAYNVRPADVIRTLGNKLRAATAAQHKIN